MLVIENQSMSVELAAAADMVVVCTDGITTVTVAGEIDLSFTDRLSEQLAAELDLAPRALIIALTPVSFCSCRGLAVLMAAASRAREAGVPCVIAAGQRAVVRPIRLLGLDRVLRLCPAVADAREAVGEGPAVPDPRTYTDTRPGGNEHAGPGEA
jgi:anti-anti-sigma factor